MSRSAFAARIERNWYRAWWRNIWLLPLWLLVVVAVRLRRRRFLRHPPAANPVPVVVVGNITVGGTGKTPLITWLAQRARELGLRPAVISRGYGGQADAYPLEVTADTDVRQCGDEPRLLFQRLQCPVVVDPQRRRAAASLAGRADIIFSDDGLQHYQLQRAAELVVVDGDRGFGNGWLLPVGPLREPVTRLNSVDQVLVNGRDFTVEAVALVNAVSGERRPLSSLQEQAVAAVAGIGNPQRFYQTLQGLGARVEAHAFPDHHDFSLADFDFARDFQGLLVMTEKDWVKCRAFARPEWWYLQVSAVPRAEVKTKLDQLLRSVSSADLLSENGIQNG